MSSENAKVKIFIGSSVEGLNIGRAIRSQLQHETETTLWSEGVFSIMSTPLHDLLVASQAFDFAVFIFHPDDEVSKRATVRDNVLFELGLFMGSIGRERCFFVAPKKRDNFRIPTDLDGIYPASYDAENSNLDAAVGDACYRILQIIRRVGASGREQETLLFSSSTRFEPTDFRGVEGRIWRNGKRLAPIGRGTLSFPGAGTLYVQRGNTEGRFEIQLRPNGPKDPSFRRKHDIPHRRLRVRCEARGEGSEHVLQFLFKDEARDKWLAHQSIDLQPGEWRPIDLHFKVPSDVDLLLRIDNPQVSAAPSSISIRSLVVTERD